MGVVRRVNNPPTEKDIIVTKPTKKNKRSGPIYDDLWHGNLDLRLATWNIRSLYRPGALYQLIKELQNYNIQIAALQEVRWPGKGECTVEDGSLLLYSGNDYGKHEYGTGFLINKRAVSSILKFVPISERICMLRIKSRWHNISLVNAYAPTELTSDDIKDRFYEDLELAFDQIPSYDAKLVLGDFNAKVGREESYFPTIGGHSKHLKSNDNGVRLISFASSKSMIVASTMFPHKNIHKGTWKSCDGKTVNQIDHVLIDTRHKSNVLDVKTFRGADCDSDHYLVAIKLKVKIKLTSYNNIQKEPSINTNRLRDKNTVYAFNMELSNKFAELEDQSDMDSLWEKTKQIVKEVGLRVLGKAKRHRRRKWWTDECERAMNKQRELRILAASNHEWDHRYKQARTDFKKIVRAAKRYHMEGILSNMETLMRANESRKFYQEIRTAKKAYQPVSQLLEDEYGNLVSEPEKQKEMWRKYFQQLLNCPPVRNNRSDLDPKTSHDNDLEPPPTLKEVHRAISRLKNHKSPGIDNIPGELWKYGGGVLQSQLYKIICRIWSEEQQPREWNVGIICPIHKKGCRKKCGNYRGIALLSTAYKVLSYILLARLEPYAEQILGDYQCGFRRGRSTVDQIFLLKQIMEKRWEYAQSVHCLFVDFTKAYDSIDRETLYRIMTFFQVPAKLVTMIKVATSTSELRVRVGGALTQVFEVATGLKQGDALSPILFNIALEYIIRKVLLIDGGVDLNGRHKIIGYADDLAILGQTESEVVCMAQVLEKEGKTVGLRISREKTEYLHMKRYKDLRAPRKDLTINGTTYKGISKFKYLGCTITDTNQREEEINTRIINALRCTAALHKVLVSKVISRTTKIRVYKTVIRPILMYGCETWTLTIKEEEKLLVAERKILRKILGPTVGANGEQRQRYNKEIESLVSMPNIIGEIKAARLRWLGHIERMGEDRAVKKAYLGKPVGRRPVGRPRYRWKDEIARDMKEMKVPDWSELAQNRKEWRILQSEAKTHFGSLSQRSK